ncbi:hypothetical protein NKG05_01470 [Oerskovia sp. M15]
MLEPLLAEVVITRNSAERSADVTDLAEVAIEIFGEDRVHTAERLDEALAIAVDRAERDDSVGWAWARECSSPGPSSRLPTCGSCSDAADHRRQDGHRAGRPSERGRPAPSGTRVLLGRRRPLVPRPVRRCLMGTGTDGTSRWCASRHAAGCAAAVRRRDAP